MQWQFPVNTADLHGEPPALFNQVNGITNRNPSVTGSLAPMSDVLKVTSGLDQPLIDLVQESNAVNLVLLMVYVGLAVASAVMLLLAARMIAARRSTEYTVLRARGASLRQVFWLGFLGAALPCVPAAALAWAAAVLLVPRRSPARPGGLVARPRGAGHRHSARGWRRPGSTACRAAGARPGPRRGAAARG